MVEEKTGVIKERLEKSRNVIIASHVRPDGDAIGSLLGLGLALRNAGKSVQMVLVDGVPSSFKHLEGSDLIVKEPTGEHDTFITVDSADFKRVGKPFENYGQPDINIDHHKTNESFGKINLIEAEELRKNKLDRTRRGRDRRDSCSPLSGMGIQYYQSDCGCPVDWHHYGYAWFPHLEHQPFCS